MYDTMYSNKHAGSGTSNFMDMYQGISKIDTFYTDLNTWIQMSAGFAPASLLRNQTLRPALSLRYVGHLQQVEHVASHRVEHGAVFHLLHVLGVLEILEVFLDCGHVFGVVLHSFDAFEMPFPMVTITRGRLSTIPWRLRQPNRDINCDEVIGSLPVHLCQLVFHKSTLESISLVGQPLCEDAFLARSLVFWLFLPPHHVFLQKAVFLPPFEDSCSSHRFTFVLSNTGRAPWKIVRRQQHYQPPPP